MIRIAILTGLPLPILTAVAIAAAPETAAIPVDSSEIYVHKPASRDGIGKVYMGREISFVMGHRGIAWLERANRAKLPQQHLLVFRKPGPES